MKVNNLNKWVSIIDTNSADDDLFGDDTEPVTVCSTWAAIWPVSAKETRENMRVEANITHNIRIRYREGIAHNMAVVFGSRELEIKGIVNWEERNIYLDMVCSEKL